MQFTESYRGQPIHIDTNQQADGSWTANAHLPADPGTTPWTLSEPSTAPTEDLAKQAALSLAVGQLDLRRSHIGKP